jgi:subtilisin family serine protease
MKKIAVTLFYLCFAITYSIAQKNAPTNWYNLDLKKDKVPGVSSERAYSELLITKISTPIIVAVIDGGTEIDHEDLKSIIWTNKKEIDNNNIDDDRNGYIDDIHGWNFIGGKNGDVNTDNLELTRVYKELSVKYEQNEPKAGANYEAYVKVKTLYENRITSANVSISLYKEINKNIDSVIKSIGTDNPTSNQLKAFKPNNAMEKNILTIAAKNKSSLKELKNQLNSAIEHYQTELNSQLNVDLDTRSIVGDNYSDNTERIYGNNHYEGPEGGHGTHVAGIIAAIRDNTIGMKGVANNVNIMVVRVVPNGDERDKDIANGIRYAVDNGAKIINMSFGKNYSPSKYIVDDAVRYAISKDVLLVHAAGNDGKNTDTSNNFPRDRYADNSGEASSWLEIGASSWQKGKTIAADFSNYGRENVDVFAPGVDIYSTIPDSKYASFNGTSMAAPVTSGVAALVWSYYPTLTANQIKDIIMQSSVKIKGKVILPGNRKIKVNMTDLCKTGGIVNAYEALKMAEAVVNKK